MNRAATHSGDRHYDLIVVGLGPVGAVAANLAGASGLRTLVIERGEAVFHQPRAIVFDAEIMRVFAAIGLADRIAAVTKPLGGSVYLGADRAPIRTFRAHPRPHPLAWHPSNLFFQPQLETILREGLARYPHVEVLAGHEVLSVEQSDGEVTVHFAGGTARGRHLLACDGASSTVRKGLGIGLDDIGFEERWLVIDAEVTGPMRWPEGYAIPPEVRDDSFSLMLCDPERPATLIPGRGAHRRWEYMLLPGERDAEVTTESWLHTQLERWIDPADVTVLRTAVYRFRALVAHRWRQGRVFLAGDAAHQTPPFFGQGMCHGIRDVAQLIWKLRLVQDGIAGDVLLDSYQAEREPHVREIIAASVAAGAEVCRLDMREALARDEAFRKAERERGIRVAMTDVVPPIRAGVIDPATGGRRLPELVLDGSRLDDRLGGRFTLLTLDPAAPVWGAIAGRTLMCGGPGADEQLTRWFAAHRARWAIVRPDRYVYAAGATAGERDAAIERLAHQLHVPTPSMEERP